MPEEDPPYSKRAEKVECTITLCSHRNIVQPYLLRAYNASVAGSIPALPTLGYAPKYGVFSKQPNFD